MIYPSWMVPQSTQPASGILPPYRGPNTAAQSQAPQPGSESLNTGDLGFRSGGGVAQYLDPRLDFQVPISGGFLDVYKDYNDSWQAPGRWIDPQTGREVPRNVDGKPGEFAVPDPFDSRNKNPGLGGWKSYKDVPTKTVYENQDHLGAVPLSLGGGKAAQTVGGRGLNVGPSPSTPTPFQASLPAVAPRESEITPFTGFQFGQEGQPGYRFMPGEFSSLTPGTSSQFSMQQPSSATSATQGLGTFRPWQEPALKALQQHRSQPK